MYTLASINRTHRGNLEYSVLHPFSLLYFILTEFGNGGRGHYGTGVVVGLGLLYFPFESDGGLGKWK